MSELHTREPSGGGEREPENRVVRRRRGLAVGALVLVCCAAALSAWLTIRSPAHRSRARTTGQSGHRPTLSASRPLRPLEYGVGLRVLRLVDDTRKILLPDGTEEPRVLVTIVRYPTLGSPTQVDRARRPRCKCRRSVPARGLRSRLRRHSCALRTAAAGLGPCGLRGGSTGVPARECGRPREDRTSRISSTSRRI